MVVVVVVVVVGGQREEDGVEDRQIHVYFTLQYVRTSHGIFPAVQCRLRLCQQRETERVSFTDTTEYLSIAGHKPA